jgi:hypothetical protein
VETEGRVQRAAGTNLPPVGSPPSPRTTNMRSCGCSGSKAISSAWRMRESRGTPMRLGMKALVAAVTGLGLAAPALAGLTTIDPSTFTSGQDVSHATPGVTLSTLTLVPTSAALGVVEFEPARGPVFASGNFFIGTSNSSWDVFGPEDKYNLNPPETDCLLGCGLLQGPGNAQPTLLDIGFNVPVSHVTVLEYARFADQPFVQAFNRQGLLVGSCVEAGPPNQISGPPGCFITDSTADISTVLVSSFSGGEQIGKIQFGVPEPATLSLLLLGLANIGLAGLLRHRRGPASRRTSLR